MTSREDPFPSIQREIEQLWRDLVYHRHPAAHFAEQPWAPPADVVVLSDSARVIFELAGVPREEVRVRILGNLLEVTGRRSAPRELHGARYHRAEIYFGHFRRLVELPWEADPDRIEALYRDGMLEIRVAAAAPARRTQVPIEERTG
jgi:HSP20 family protein